MRSSVGPQFSVTIKRNSADLRRRSFDASDARAVVQILNAHAARLVELPGGSYEAPAMPGQTRDGRALAREAYFLEFARDSCGCLVMAPPPHPAFRRCGPL